MSPFSLSIVSDSYIHAALGQLPDRPSGMFAARGSEPERFSFAYFSFPQKEKYGPRKEKYGSRKEKQSD
ncbi:hypothetical protein [Butyricicoccus sp.]|uniref:hypothetical protein n=1 Tax=Butyricicoccus sp. TaxID=2049021 RepID=UPI003F180958